MTLRFGEHIVLFSGAINNAQQVQHQACCVVNNPDSKIELETTEVKMSANVILIPSLISHRIIAGNNTRFLFIDPSCSFSVAHREVSSLVDNKIVDDIGQQLIEEFYKINIPFLDNLVSNSSFIENRIKTALSLIKNNLHRTISTKEIATACFLSESRLQHCFKEQLGMPIRKYIHWQRIVASTKSIAAGNKLTQAAYIGGFADGAHFTRTFKNMFGVPPSFFF